MSAVKIFPGLYHTSHYLDELSPVGFGNMDASVLLSSVEQLSLPA